jgi:DNA-binding NarL/FixJ family response regulator
MSRPPNAKLRVYLVEDSDRIRDRLIERVEGHGLGNVIGYADSEEEAVTEILRLKPDAVVLDIQLRIGNGLTVLRKLRNLLPESMPAVIVYTDYAIAEFSRHAAYQGARYFLDKASDLDHLGGMLKSLGEQPRISV